MVSVVDGTVTHIWTYDARARKAQLTYKAEPSSWLAGPLDGKEGRRGFFVFATPEIEEARKLVATDPVIVQGEMVAE